MDILRRTKVLKAITILLFLANCVNSEGEVDDPKGEKTLAPPTEIMRPPFPFGETLTPTSAILIWKGSPTANNYIITIFRVENQELILHEEIRNVPEEEYKIEDLDPSTSYEVIVKAARVHLNGTNETSVHSKPFSFKTLDACKGARIHVACTAHCVITCERQRPACDRRCVSGCTCPRDIPFVHNGKCISKEDCKDVGAPLTEVLGRPTHLKLHRIKGSNDLLFTWSEVEGADFYTVIVTTKDGTVVQTIDNIKIPFQIIKGLKPKVPYKFKVQSKFFKFGPGRALAIGLTKPVPPEILQVSDRSFYARWEEYPNAKTYKLVLTAPKAKEPLHVFKNLKETYITIQGLSPGTTYDITLIVVTTADVEIESDIVSAKTIGNKDDELDFFDPTEISYIAELATTTTTEAPTTAPYVATCEERKNALEAYPEPHSEHIPDCDGGGNFKTRQCEKGKGCYCVERITGHKRPGSDFKSPDSEYALDCSKYGQFKIPPIEVTTTAIDTRSIRVKWQRNPNADFYTVKVFNGFEGGFVTHVSGIKRNVAIVDGLSRGSPYVVIVVGVDKDGRQSPDKVKGDFVATPHLDPPTDVKLEQIDEHKMKVSWKRNEIALHYQVEIYENGKENPETYDNVTEDYVIFDVKGNDQYKVSVKSTGVTTIPGSGQTVLISSNSVEVSRRPTCVFPALDIIFVIDVSTKMTTENYKKAKELFVMLIQSLTPMSTSLTDTTGTRFAAVKAWSTARTVFRFENKYNQVSGVAGAIRFVRQVRSSQFNFGQVLDYIYKNFFSPANNDDQRENVATAVILFPGGPSDDENFALKAARLRSVTNVITVGVRGHVRENDVIISASDKSRIMIPSYDDIDEAYDRVMEILCNIK